MTLPTACPLDCPDRCAMEATVAEGRLLRLEGSHRSPWTAGFICQKVADFPARVHGPHRIGRPARRVGPKGPGARFEPISWDEALDVLTAEFQARLSRPAGGGAIQPVWYGGSNGLLTGGAMDQRFWDRIGARRLDRTLCAANNGAAAARVWPGMPAASQSDVDAAAVVVVWGMNPKASGIHLLPALQRLHKRGGSLIVVDPRQTSICAGALHIPLLPGTDHALAKALLHIALRDGHVDWGWLRAEVDGADEVAARMQAWTPARAAAECGVDVGRIEEMARIYAAGAPSLLRCGWGAERNRRATTGYEAILMLPAFYQQVGRRGAGYALSSSGGYGMTRSQWNTVPNPAPNPWPVTNLSQLAQTLDESRDPVIDLVFVYNCNPVATVPDQRRLVAALRAPGRFVVVHEQVWTDSCDEADLVLPATTFAEHHELSRSYGGYDLHWAPPVIPPVGEARSNHALFQGLAARLGFGDEPAFQPDAVALAAQIVTGSLGAEAWARLQRDQVLLPEAPVQWVDRRPTRRPDWTGLAAEVDSPARDAALPLVLLSPASPRAITSTGFESVEADSIFLDIHPEDAGERGLAEGDWLRVFNSLGEVVVRAHLDPALRRGVVSLPKGLWRKHTRNGWTATALAPPEVDPIGQGACYNDARVEVSRWVEGLAQA